MHSSLATAQRPNLFACLFQTKRSRNSYTADEFQRLCFDYGIELDEDTEDDPSRPKDEPAQFKIETPANRADLLCFEGIATSLNVFRGKMAPPAFKVLDMPEDQMQSITVKPETADVRPYIAGAILRNVKFTQSTYNSFMGLQEKLHANLARQRTLVAIGTHDLDTVKGPFTYEARKPEDIKFRPLNQAKEMDGNKMMETLDKGKLSLIYFGAPFSWRRDHHTDPALIQKQTSTSANTCTLSVIRPDTLSSTTPARSSAPSHPLSTVTTPRLRSTPQMF